LRNLFDAESVCEADLFDSVAMSEILEHLEDPVAALKAAARQIRPGGRVFINVPANSPAPDHIFLFTDLAHAVRIIEQGGFSVESSAAFPMVGVTLKQAQKHRLSVSCVIVGRKA
jgi:2-polyprenyl-3-methyl-5-hydroxy-6-metoxy-1,4-benzoquinol methylase